MPIIELTDHCNLKCPVCLVKNRNSTHLAFAEFVRIMDTLERCEGTLNLVNLSGGEPLLHPEIERIAEHLASRQVVMSSISTNGLQLLKRPELVPFFRDLGIVISLQMDGFLPDTSCALRGIDLAASKRRVIDLLLEQQAPFSLTVTLVKGYNETEIPAILDLFFKADNALSLMIQPCSYTGSGGGAFAHDPLDIITIPDVAKLLAASSQGVLESSDFLPLPCSHPSCFALTYLLKLADGALTPVSRLFDLDDYLDVIKNNALLGMGEDNLNRVKDSIYRLWTASGMIPNQDAVLQAVRNILTSLNDNNGGLSAKSFMSVTEKHIKSIFIHHFMDAHTFDLARAVKCCQQYPQADGRLLPVCVFNNLMR
ncbi:MAG: radical SAM protein [Cyanobacteria bacterium NC_groundwater_1444_Ag_S-0.65um_54_12]|nr:radical SAM protein [Cyanobacteria bacterium NC_groundwater_1444_Ag_S-0.65um_54_12]